MLAIRPYILDLEGKRKSGNEGALILRFGTRGYE
jgi:hypothetical protein